ncbi:MAG: hypothetical protein Q7S50_01275 [bacterium]|nr:hypothetical protein [bacterium]
MDESSTLPRVSHPRRISWLTIILALLAVGTFIAISRPDVSYYGYPGIGGLMESTFKSSSVDPVIPQGVMINESSSYAVPTSAQGVSDAIGMSVGRGGGMPVDYYPYPTPNVPASDTRELLKVNYNATMQTRDAQGLTRRVETTVRGHGGRIDQESSSEKYGYVSFVVPMSKYETFRTELESLVPSRFLSVDIQSQNMLPQKQSIEEQQKQADTSLTDAKAARQRIVNTHASTVKSIQTQIDANVRELASLRAQTLTYEIQLQIQTVSNELLWQRQQLADENASYSGELSNADANIKYAQDWQKAVKTQDQALMDDVATVSGTVSLQWISLWQMAQLYLPGYWIPAIFAALALLSYLWDRRRFGTV